jgi:hypothetical protein
MQLTQTYPADYLGKQTFTALDDKFVIHYKNLLREYTVEYTYSEFRTKTMKSRHGDTDWTTLGWNLLFAIIVLSLVVRFIYPEITQSLSFALFLVALLIGSLIAHLMRFVKHDTVSFFDKDNDYICEIKFTNKNKKVAHELVEFLVERVKKQVAEDKVMA